MTVTSEAKTGEAIATGIIAAMALGASNFMARDPALSIERAAPSTVVRGKNSLVRLQ